ncbi:twinfilin [Pseudozyma hubeiensis SY62]|uniref:Twinfilin n=1 Tax=Pseudozyma hubeiensis (strain SY62) TaxID=1305764 RepID=R9P065_PSEHS|nr:twinfilin [Pseudozyma hubeiensis SY62]GAC94511.1 twinfilin [Pseudozyma hubeiensis SY62]
MSNIPIADDLAQAFKQADESVRAILVQNDGGFLKLVDTASPSSPDVSDKEDFVPVLSKLFANDPQRSGYALYRLDSQSASGEWEWLCCSYQPDGAKIKEKMQYAITRSSLMAGLTERNFLETIFGATPRDFLWPTKLRNSRKHDYQNPQLKTAGMAASEAAGTGSGGAKRNFGSAGRTNNLRSADESSNDTPTKAAAAASSDNPSNLGSTSGVTGVNSVGASGGASPAAERPELVPESEQPTVASAPVPKRYNSHEFTSAFKSPTPPATDAKLEEAAPLLSSPVDKEDNAKQFASEVKAPAEPTTPRAAQGQSDSLSQPTVPSDSTLAAAANVASAVQKDEPESKVTTAEQEFVESKAPQEPPTPSAETSSTPLSQPTLPTSLDQASLGDDVPQKNAVSIEKGSGPSTSGLTQREEELAELRRLQATERASTNSNSTGSGAGGPAVGFKWGDGVLEAIQGLASTASGTSEWNLVVLAIDLRSETVELESPPRFVPPADLPSALSANDPRIAFYRLDNVSMQTSGESVVAMLYCCPASSGVKARMVYSSNVLIIMNHVKGFSGMRVVKKLEASDRDELTHALVEGEVEEILKQERHKFAGTGFEEVPQTVIKEGGFARPRKAGASSRH